MPKTKTSQWERLVAAAVQVASRYGYGEATVARIVSHAGVSRATFYEHFEDRDACVLAAYSGIAPSVETKLAGNDTRERPPDWMRDALAELLDAAARDPAATRLLLIESLAAGAEVRAAHERLLDLAESAIEATLNSGADEVPAIEIPPRALLGGIADVVSIRVFRGEACRLPALLDDLMAWIDSYEIPAGIERLEREDWARLGAGLSGGEVDDSEEEGLSRPLPRGRGALPPSVVSSEHQDRVLTAVARLCREKGYAVMTVSDIVSVASVPRQSFYRLFRSKEDAFLAAQAFALENSVSRAAGKYFSGESWPDRVWNAALPMLGYIGSMPDLTILNLIESYAAGPSAIRRLHESRMAYTLFLEEGYRQSPQAEALPKICSEAIAGAILELMRRQTVIGCVGRMPQLVPQAVFIALAPFIGPAQALEFVQGKVSSAV